MSVSVHEGGLPGWALPTSPEGAWPTTVSARPPPRLSPCPCAVLCRVSVCHTPRPCALSLCLCVPLCAPVCVPVQVPVRVRLLLAIPYIPRMPQPRSHICVCACVCPVFVPVRGRFDFERPLVARRQAEQGALGATIAGWAGAVTHFPPSHPQRSAALWADPKGQECILPQPSFFPLL